MRFAAPLILIGTVWSFCAVHSHAILLPFLQTSQSTRTAFQGAAGETPKGWFVSSQGYTAQIVAEGAKSEEHGVLMQKNARMADSAEFGNLMRSFSAAPFRGKRLRFRARIRFEGDKNKSQCQMWMRVARANGVRGFFDNMSDRPIVTDSWKSYDIIGPVAADAETINVGVMLFGEGKAWIDDVVLEFEKGNVWIQITESDLTRPFVPSPTLLEPKREKEIVFELKQHIVPLATVEAGHGFKDLAPLDKIVGDARIVSLGEASHGTREFFQMKHRILEYLVSKKGFTVFAIEANWPESELLDRYIKTGEGNPKSGLYALYFWTWYTQELADMVQWMRDYNRRPGSHPQITFTGFDMQYPDLAAAQVRDYFERADKINLAAVVRSYAHALHTEASTGTPEELSADKKHAEDVVQLLEARSDALIRASSETEYRHARQCAQVVLQAATMRASGQKGAAVRDRCMAENVKWLADTAYPKQKLMLWAHNGHVADTTAYGVSSMGHNLRQMYASKIVSIGFGFDRGQIRAVQISADKIAGPDPIPLPVPPAIKGSVESVLREAGPRYLLDFRSVPPRSALAAWLSEPNVFRQPGAVWDPTHHEAFFQPISLSKSFDGIIFIAESHASQLLPYEKKAK